jgi:tetratricopeptide (TPR) repeat protein
MYELGQTMQRLLLRRQAILSLLGVSLGTTALLEVPAAVARPTQQMLISQGQSAHQILIDSAITKKKNGDFQGAIADATKAIQLDPNKAHYYFVRAEARTQIRDYQGTIADATKAIQLSGKKYVDPYFYRVRANARIGIRDYQGAIADATKAIQINSLRPAASASDYYVRAEARIKLKDYQGAIADATKAIQNAPSYGNAFVLRANARRLSGDYQGALADANRSLNYASADYDCLNERLAAGDDPPGLADFNRRIQLDPKSEGAYSGRACIKLGQKDYQGAIADLDRAIQLDPNDASSYSLRSSVNGKLGNFQKALSDAKYYRQLLPSQLLPNNPYTFIVEAEALIGLKNYSEAISAAEKAIAIDPTREQAYYYRGLARLKQGDTQGAISDYNKAIQLSPSLVQASDDYTQLARQDAKPAPVATAPQPSPQPKAPNLKPQPEPKPTPVATTSQPSTPSASSSQNVYQVAKQTTVLIGGQNPGSGVIFAKAGNTYYVLTAKHVVATPDEYEIIAADGKRYPVDYKKVKKLPNIDLAVIEFTSQQPHATARLGNSQQVQEGDSIFVAGWPAPDAAITQPTRIITEGKIAGLQTSGADGYELVYSNSTSPGMSGGPVLDAQGQLIGIHGRASGNQDSGKVGLNLGIPINLFLRQAPQIGLNLQKLGLRAEK